MSLYERLLFFKDPALGALLAFMVATAVLALLRRWQAAALPAALGSGFLAGQVALCGWPAFPPHDAVQRLFYLGGAAIIVSLVPGGRGRWLVYFVLLGAAWTYLIPAPVRSSWTAPEQAGWLFGLAAAALVFGLCASTLVERQPGPFPVLLLLSLAFATAIVLGLSHSAVLGQLSGVFGIALVPAVIAVWLSPVFALRANAAFLSAILLPGLWIVHLFTAEAVPTASLALLAAAPGVAWLASRIGPSGSGVLIGRGISFVPIVAALGLVAVSVTTDPSGPGAVLPSSASSFGDRPGHAPKPAEELSSTVFFAEDINPFRQWTEPDKK